MNYKQPVGDGLGIDDYYAARYLYPSEESVDDLIGCGSVGAQANKGSNRLIELLFLLLPLTLVLFGEFRYSFKTAS